MHFREMLSVVPVVWALCFVLLNSNVARARSDISWSERSCGSPMERLLSAKSEADRTVQEFQGKSLADIDRDEFASASLEQGRIERALTLWHTAETEMAEQLWKPARSTLQRLRILVPQIGEVHCSYALVLIELGDQKQAITSLKKALETAQLPNLEVVHLKLGNMLRAIGNYTEAQQQFRMSLSLNESSATAHEGLASSLDGDVSGGLQVDIPTFPSRLGSYNATAGEQEEAMHHYNRAIQLGSDSAQIQARIALLYIHREEWEAASRHLTHAVQQWPQSVMVHHLLSLVLQTRAFVLQQIHGEQSEEVTKLFQRATFHLQQATWLDRNAFEPHVNLAELLWMKNRYSDALPHAMTGVRSQPLSVRANIVMSFVLESLNRMREAIEQVDVAAKLVELGQNVDSTSRLKLLQRFAAREQVMPWHELLENQFKLTNRLAVLLTQHGEYDRAILQLEKCEKLSPGNLQVQLLMAKALHGIGNHSRAESIYTKLINQCSEVGSPECSSATGGAKAGLAKVLLETHGESSRAVELYEDAFSSDSWDDLGDRLSLVRIYENMNQWQGALRHLKYVVDKWPESSKGYQAMGKFLLKRGSYPEAHHFYQMATLLDPKCIPCHIGNGESFLYIGKSHRALDSFRAALKLSGSKGNALAQLRMGDVLMKLSKYEIARKSYFKSIDLLTKGGTNSSSLRMIAQNNLAVTFFHEGEFGVAAHWFRETLKEDPSNRISHTNLAQILSMSGPKETQMLFQFLVARFSQTSNDFWSFITLQLSAAPQLRVPSSGDIDGLRFAIQEDVESTGEGEDEWVSILELMDSVLQIPSNKLLASLPSATLKAIQIIQHDFELPFEDADESDRDMGDGFQGKSAIERLASLDNLTNGNAPKFDNWMKWQPHKDEIEDAEDRKPSRPLSVCSGRYQGVGLRGAASFIELGQMLIESGDVDEAIKCFRAVAEPNEDRMVLIAQAELSFALELVGEWEDALEISSKVLSKLALDDAYHLGLILLATRLAWAVHRDVYTVAQQGNGETVESARLSTIAVDTHPEEASAHFLHASILSEKKELLNENELNSVFASADKGFDSVSSMEPDATLLRTVFLFLKLELLRLNPSKFGGLSAGIAICAQGKSAIAEFEKTNRALLVIPNDGITWKREPTGWRATRSKYMMELGALYPDFAQTKSQLLTVCGEMFQENQQMQESADSYLDAIRSQSVHWPRKTRGENSSFAGTFHPRRAYVGLAQLLKQDMQHNLATSLLRAAVLSQEGGQAGDTNSNFTSRDEAREVLETQLVLARSLVENGQSAWAVVELLDLVTAQNPFKDIRGYALELMVNLLRRFGSPREANTFLHQLMELLRSHDEVGNQRNLAGAEQLSMSLLKEQVLLTDAERYLEEAKRLVEESNDFENARSYIDLALSIAPANCRSRLLTMAARIRRSMGDADWIHDLKKELLVLEHQNQTSHSNQEIHPTVVLEVAKALEQEKYSRLDVFRAFKPLLGNEYFEVHEPASVILPLINMQSILQQAGVFDRVRKQWWDTSTALEMEAQYLSANASMSQDSTFPAPEDKSFILFSNPHSLIPSHETVFSKCVIPSVLSGPLTRVDHQHVEERELKKRLMESLGLSGTKAHVLRHMSRNHALEGSWFTSLVYHRLWVLESLPEDAPEAHLGTGEVLLRLLRMPSQAAGRVDLDELHTLGLDHFHRVLSRGESLRATSDGGKTVALAHCGLGAIYLDQNRTREALAEFQEAMGAVDRPERDAPCSTLGVATGLAVHGEHADAIQLFEQVLNSETEDDFASRYRMVPPQAFVWYAWYLENQERGDMAIWLLEQALEVAPNEPDLHAALGNNYFKNGDFKRAEKAFQSAFNLDFQSQGFLLNNLAVTRAMLGKPESALGMLKQALVQKPQTISRSVVVAQTPMGVNEKTVTITSSYNLALVFEKRQQWDAASFHLHEVLKLINAKRQQKQDKLIRDKVDKQRTLALLSLGRVLWNAGKVADAQQVYTELADEVQRNLNTLRAFSLLDTKLHHSYEKDTLESAEDEATWVLEEILTKQCLWLASSESTDRAANANELIHKATYLMATQAGIRLTEQQTLDLIDDPVLVWNDWFSKGIRNLFTAERYAKLDQRVILWLFSALETISMNANYKFHELAGEVLRQTETWQNVSRKDIGERSKHDESTSSRFALVSVWLHEYSG